MNVDLVGDGGGVTAQLERQALGAAELLLIGVGLDLDLYRPLVDSTVTAAELAATRDTDPMYTRVWLEQQTVAGMIERQPAAGADTFWMAPATAEALLNPSSPRFAAAAYIRPQQQLFRLRHQLADAYRTGGGLTGAQLGDFHGGELNTALFDGVLPRWLQRAVDDRAWKRSDALTVVDLGCGYGTSTLMLARQFPNATVIGIDRDGGATASAARRPHPPRVTFHHNDALHVSDHADLVCIFDTLHEVGDPVALLSAAHRICRPGGLVLLLEPAAADRFDPMADRYERFLYCCSLLHCLPLARADPAGTDDPTGAVLRAATVRRLAAAAGFTTMTRIDSVGDDLPDGDQPSGAEMGTGRRWETAPVRRSHHLYRLEP